MIKRGVVITKLAANQQIKLELYATKNIAKEHAKFSTVNVCYYRLFPRIILEKDFKNEEAFELQKKV